MFIHVLSSFISMNIYVCCNPETKSSSSEGDKEKKESQMRHWQTRYIYLNVYSFFRLFSRSRFGVYFVFMYIFFLFLLMPRPYGICCCCFEYHLDVILVVSYMPAYRHFSCNSFFDRPSLSLTHSRARLPNLL